MTFRQAELQHFSRGIAWLEPTAARRSYEYASAFSSAVRYGLESTRVVEIERHIIDSESVARAWVRSRIGTGNDSVRVVIGPKDVFLTSASFFSENWPDFFCPARDDALILSDTRDWILFYDHEDELEFGRRLPVSR